MSNMNISSWIERNAAFNPTKTALRFEGVELSYAEMAEQVEAVARMLKWELGVGRGDRVALLGYNSPEFLLVVFACARLGAMFLPLNWRLATPEHLYILKDASVKALLLEEDFVGLIDPVHAELPHCRIVGLDFAPTQGQCFADLLQGATGDSSNPHIDLDCPHLLVYTSGTTGRPKGAVLTQDALLWNAVNSIHLHDMTGQDHVLTVIPLFHVGGLNNQTTPALHCGATVTLHRRFHPDETLRSIHMEKPSLTCLVPATMQACIASPLWQETDFSNLRINLTGSTTVPGHLSDSFREQGVAVLEMYGATETSPIAIYQRTDSDFSKRGSTGLPALHCQVRVVDDVGNELPPNAEGEIVVKGPTTMFEYWGNEAATAESLRNGWYHTGDIGYRDADGYFFIIDRKKHVIISGGENIYPAEVERVLYEFPDVAEVAVVGQSDERWQEIPIAVIATRTGVAPNEVELRQWLNGQLARYKIPKQFVFVDELPKNAMGKVQHYRVKEELL